MTKWIRRRRLSRSIEVLAVLLLAGAAVPAPAFFSAFQVRQKPSPPTVTPVDAFKPPPPVVPPVPPPPPTGGPEKPPPATPEPATLATGLIGLGALAAWKRWRKRT